MNKSLGKNFNDFEIKPYTKEKLKKVFKRKRK
jgi:two-component SAPR family response regulator